MAADSTASGGQRRQRRAVDAGQLDASLQAFTAIAPEPLAESQTGPATTPTARGLQPDEWREGVAQRRSLTILGFREAVMSLIATSPDGENATLSIDRDQRHALAAAALHGDADGFSLQDCNDEILAAVLLASYERGVPFSELGAPLRATVRDLIARRGDLARRLAALIPPG